MRRMLSASAIGNITSDRITLGVVAGLVLGKTLGVFGATMLALRLRIGERPAGTTSLHLLGLAIVAGVGFTVALFVASLSFESAAATDSAKVGILLGSLIAGVVGYLVLRAAPGRSDVAADQPQSIVAEPSRWPGEAEPVTARSGDALGDPDAIAQTT